MKADLATPCSTQRLSRCARFLLAATAGILTLLASGCYGPAKGPTDPKDFIVQGKQWNTPPPSNAPTTDPTAPATAP